MNALNVSVWAFPLIMMGSALVVGVIFETVLLAKLKPTDDHPLQDMNHVLTGSLRGMTVFWFMVAGVYVASLRAPIDPPFLMLLHKVLHIIVIVSGTIVAARIALGFLDHFNKKTNGALPSTTLFKNLARFFIFGTGALITLQTLGISVAPILAALGLGGLSVALGLQDTLKSLFAGIQVIVSQEVGIGDTIQFDSGEQGIVADITWRYTTIRTPQNNLIIVPNSKFTTAVVTNFNRPTQEVVVPVPCTVAYGSDLEQVERITLEVAKDAIKEAPGAVPSFDPSFVVTAFGESGIQFIVVLKARNLAGQDPLRHAFIKKLHARYEKDTIRIPYPTRTVHVHTGIALRQNSIKAGVDQ